MAPGLGLPFASVAAEGAAGRRVVEVSAAWPVGVMDRADAVPLCERPVPGLRGCLSLGPSRPGPGRGDPAASSQKGLERGSIRQERARVPGRPREVSGQCLGRGWRSSSSSGGVALGPGPLLPTQPRPARESDSGRGQPAGSPQPLHEGRSSPAGAEGSAIHAGRARRGTRSGRAGPRVSACPPRPPAWTNTGVDVFTEGIYCSGTKVAHSYLTGVHCVGLVRFRDVCVCPKYKRGRLTRAIAFGVLCLRSPAHACRAALAVTGV